MSKKRITESGAHIIMQQMKKKRKSSKARETKTQPKSSADKFREWDKKNIERRRRYRLKVDKEVKNLPHDKKASVPRAGSDPQRPIPKWMLEAIINKDFATAERLFNEHMEAIAEMRIRKQKEVVAKKMVGPPFGPSMKHYRQQIRAAVKKMKKQTKIVDGPTVTIKHGNLNEVTKEKLAKYIKKAHHSGGLADYQQGQLWNKSSKAASAERQHHGKRSTKRSKGIELAVDKLTGKAKVPASDEGNIRRRAVDKLIKNAKPKAKE